MTSDNTEKASGTLTSLINTIQRHVSSREDNDQDALDNIEKLRLAWEKAEPLSPEQDRLFHSLQEAVSIVRARLLIEDLLVALSKNPFPGGQHRLLAVATTLFPKVKGLWGYRGRLAWKAILQYYRLDYRALVWFPEAGVLSIEEVEQQLLALVAEEGYLPASALAAVLSSSPSSAYYRTTKATLQGRGWSWSTRRYNNTTIKTILPPHYHGTILCT